MAAIDDRHGLGVALVAATDDVGAAGLRIRPVGHDVTVGVLVAGLAPDAVAVLQTQGPRIALPAHAGEGAEIVVEGAVFLHEDDDVLDIH